MSLGTRRAHKLTTTLLVIYLNVMLWIILFKLNVPFSHRADTRRLNLVPFDQPLILNGRMDAGEMILNFIVFIPLGLYLAVLFRSWSIIKKIAAIAIISFSLEAIQYIFQLGAADITDLITNTMGGMAGLGIVWILDQLLRNPKKLQGLINILGAIGTVLILAGLAWLKINGLWIFRGHPGA